MPEYYARAQNLWGEAKPKQEENYDETMKIKAKPVDLDKLLAAGATKNRVYRVGLEVEGAWDKLPAGAKLTGDVSVFRNGFKPEVQAMFPVPPTCGELTSPPIDVCQIPQWIKKHCPKYVDDTCGLHIHMSFKHALHYDRLMVETYPATLLHYLGRWAKEEAKLPANHCIWDRLAGKSKYCRNIFWPDLQATKDHKEHNVDREGNRKGHRYTSVNYCWGLGFETVEIRVMPMMPSVDLNISALEKVIDVTNAFLASVRKEPKFGVKAKADDIKPFVAKRVFHV